MARRIINAKKEITLKQSVLDWLWNYLDEYLDSYDKESIKQNLDFDNIIESEFYIVAINKENIENNSSIIIFDKNDVSGWFESSKGLLKIYNLIKDSDDSSYKEGGPMTDCFIHIFDAKTGKKLEAKISELELEEI